MINIAIADDHPIVLDGLKNLLDKQEGFYVQDVFSNGETLLDSLKGNRPDVLLLDINLPDMSGLDLAPKIKTRYTDMKVIILSVHNEFAVINSMLIKGADGYIQKNVVSTEIVDGIRTVMAGKRFLCSQTKQIVTKKENEGLQVVPKITRREREILQCVAEGLTTVQIGDKLFISPHTVESHRKNLMEKFDVKNLSSVIKLATEYGLLH
ncbi:response regulator [Olivibacter sitiensis]|uniref:response regulator n=1 Tax=Olivibacter sitiensis TaxID=376470 RepID=UPI0003F89E55|nr:response regulator transcription factor [Olivibacter sitiensis]